VLAGPGINDNGSGSAALLEIAQNLANHKPRNTIRFAWWGAEELGLLGSTAWVAAQPEEELDRIALYMNFDMVASPNFIHMVYDADESTFPAPEGVVIPEGSIAIEDVFESYYTMVGIPYDDTEFSGRSDYEAFILSDIPSSGLFTGAEVEKSEAQQDIWGGIAGEQFDQCYHEACDTIDNISVEALEVNVDAIAFAVLTYGYSTESVNGVPGHKVPGGVRVPAPAGPEGTFVDSEGAGGFLHGVFAVD
jgi:Zn-dependent M28 family amino/carboxypeptidase